MGISAWIGTKVEQPGSLTVPARTFVDLVSNLPSDEVALSVDEHTNTLNVRCGTLNTDIKGISADEFPPMPTPDLTTSIPLNVANFKEMIQQVVFAASREESRPNLTGVHLSFEGDYLVMAATDGYRISISKAIMAQKQPKSWKRSFPPAHWRNWHASPSTAMKSCRWHFRRPRPGHLPPTRCRVGLSTDRRKLPQLRCHHSTFL